MHLMNTLIHFTDSAGEVSLPLAQKRESQRTSVLVGVKLLLVKGGALHYMKGDGVVIH